MADDVVITVRNNGPYHIKGTFRVATQGGRELAVEEGQAWLCRCGHSKTPVSAPEHARKLPRELLESRMLHAVEDGDHLNPLIHPHLDLRS